MDGKIDGWIDWWMNILERFWNNKIAVACVTVWRSIILIPLHRIFFLFERCCFPLSRVFCLWEELLPLEKTFKNRNDVIITSKLNRLLWNSDTINRTKVPTFSPSLIKTRPIVSDIYIISRKSGTDTQTDKHTHTHKDKVCRSLQSTDCDNTPFTKV